MQSEKQELCNEKLEHILKALPLRQEVLYLTTKVNYKGGEVLCNVEITDLYIVRQPFKEIKTVGELASVEAKIDTTSAKIKYNTYQNYKIGGGVN